MVFGVLSACDNYLDITPKGQVILEEVEEYNLMFNDDNLHSFWNDKLCYLTDERWPTADYLITGDEYPIEKANFLWDENYDRASFWELDAGYDKLYQRISRYNIIIKGVPDAEGDETRKKEVIAMAKILRAYNHFVLINVYAKHYQSSTASSDRGVLLVKEFNMEQKLVQSTVQDAYDFILRDINEALNDLPDVPENTFHPGKAFGYGFLAKVHLFMKNFPAALEAANTSLTYNDFVFDMVAYYNTGGGEVGYDMNEHNYFAGGMSPFIPNWAMLSPTAVERYDVTSDVRISYLFYNTWYGQPAYLNYAFKYNVAGMRVPEVLLIKAECMARAGEVDGAMAVLNDFRVDRILPANYAELTATTSKEAVLHIIDERAREFAHTYNRLWDMKRLNTETEYAKTYSKEFSFDGGQTYETFTVEPGSHVFIMPFSQEAMNRNSSLKQNTK